jgi:hypothetical protein
MRLHIVDVKDIPYQRLPDGDNTIIDYPHWVGYEAGDQIQIVTPLGTAVYFVEDVVPEWDGMREMHIVYVAESGYTIKGGH